MLRKKQERVRQREGHQQQLEHRELRKAHNTLQVQIHKDLCYEFLKLSLPLTLKYNTLQLQQEVEQIHEARTKYDRQVSRHPDAEFKMRRAMKVHTDPLRLPSSLSKALLLIP